MENKDRYQDHAASPRLVSPALGIQAPDTPPTLYPAARDYFQSIPWCAALLSDPSVVSFVPSTRNPASDEHEQLMGRTLADARTVEHMLCLFTPEDPAHTRDPARPITSVSSLIALGQGLSSYPGYVHGGMIMVLMDESTANVLEINAALGKDAAPFKSSNMTGSLETKFLRPVPVNSILQDRRLYWYGPGYVYEHMDLVEGKGMTGGNY
ncbi:hypothetical protein S40293_03464 [Stachybotrys chartarum IBT 40293]|nr:hypothetical protein S40293_03464 [Stachybotrys chartarum IBT 40293]